MLCLLVQTGQYPTSTPLSTTRRCMRSMLLDKAVAPSTLRRSCHQRTRSKFSNNKCSGNSSSNRSSTSSRLRTKTTASCSSNSSRISCPLLAAPAPSRSLARTQAVSISRRADLCHIAVGEISRRSHRRATLRRGWPRQSPARYRKLRCLRVRSTSNLAKFSWLIRNTVKPSRCSLRACR